MGMGIKEKIIARTASAFLKAAFFVKPDEITTQRLVISILTKNRCHKKNNKFVKINQ